MKNIVTISPPNHALPNPGKATWSSWLLLVSLIAGSVLRVIVMVQSAPLDDAYITFRYARNIASGLGFVYNEGERVLGTTTPLWTILLSLFARAGVPLDTSAVILGIILDLTVCWLLWRLLARHGDIVVASLSACFYATFYAVVSACGYGMETQFFMLLLILAFTWALEAHYYRAAAAVGASVLTRPEGLLLAGLLALALLWSLRRRRLVLPWGSVALYMGILLGWSIVATLYFGSPIPNSVVAKMHIAGMGPTDWLGFFFLRNPLVTLLWILGGIGTAVALRTASGPLLLFSAWTFAYALFFLVGDPAFFAAWYFPPAALTLLPLAAAGIDTLARPFVRRRSVRALTIGTVWTLSAIALLPRTLESSRATKRAAEQVYRPLAEWVRDETNVNDTIFAGDIGYLGYFSERHLLDAAALVSPEVWNYYAAHRDEPFPDVRFILEQRPKFVVVSMGFGAYSRLKPSNFSDFYVPVRRFTTEKEADLEPPLDSALQARRNTKSLIADYLVYQRRR